MRIDLEGRTAIVTGAAQGLGLHQAESLCLAGARVVLTDLRAEAGEEAARTLRGKGLDARFHLLDVADRAQWREAVAASAEEWGAPRILVNNAAVLSTRGLEDETDDGWDLLSRVNQRGVWLGMQAVTPGMKETGGGSIVNIGSINGLVAAEGHIAYQASKGAVRMMSKNAAVSLAKHGIRVNCVHPGVMDTAQAHDAGDESDDEFVAATPLGRLGHPREVADAVTFLASDLASYITGADLAVDGGFTAH